MSGWPNEHSRSFGGDLPTVHESHTPPLNTHPRLDTLGLPFVVPCRPHVCGPPGPKSRDHSTLAGRWLHCLVLSFMITPSRAVIDARVPASARDAGGAASASGWLTHVAAKPSGRSEATCVSQPIDQNLRIRKRTFRRAVARAGGAYYKGRWRSAQHFGVPVAASDTLHETASTRPLRTPKHPSPDASPLPKHL